MTNTKFRKRALLSSVAMLLVALVALGSATFAWFSTTDRATASTIVAKTNQASNILLNEHTLGTGGVLGTGFASEWGTSITFKEGTSTSTAAMVPVTTHNFSDWHSVMAEGYNLGYSTTAYSQDNEVANIKDAATYARYTTLYIKNTGDDTDAEITCSFNGQPNGFNYIRVALVPIPANQANDTTAAGSNNIIFGSNNDYTNTQTHMWSSSGGSTSSIVGASAHNFGSPLDLPTLETDEVYGYDVYVYFEGTDQDCKDINAGGTISLEFTVNAKAATPEP